MSIAAGFRSWWSHLKAENEYQALGHAERSAIARDIGLAEEVLDRIVEQGSSEALELPRLLNALSMDAGEIRRDYPAVMRDLDATCAGCEAHAQCHRDLDHGVAEGAYRSYCPNALTIGMLAAERSVSQAAA